MPPLAINRVLRPPAGWQLVHSASRPCGQVNRAQFVLQYYTRVSPLAGFAPAATSASVVAPSALSFQVTPKAPSSGVALQVSWQVDGLPQSGETAVSFSRLSDFIADRAGRPADEQRRSALHPAGGLSAALNRAPPHSAHHDLPFGAAGGF